MAMATTKKTSRLRYNEVMFTSRHLQTPDWDVMVSFVAKDMEAVAS